MGRPRKVIAPVADIPAEYESQEPPDPDFLTPEQSIAAAEQENFALGNGSVSKAQMVRLALAEGIEGPADGTAWIKARYGIDMPRQVWSSYSAQQRARERKAEGGETTPRTRTHASMQPTGIPAGFSSDVRELRALVEKAGGGDELKEQIGQLSGLIGKYGASGLGELIDAIA